MVPAVLAFAIQGLCEEVSCTGAQQLGAFRIVIVIAGAGAEDFTPTGVHNRNRPGRLSVDNVQLAKVLLKVIDVKATAGS